MHFEDGETPIQRLERERKDCFAALALLKAERELTEHLVAVLESIMEAMEADETIIADMIRCGMPQAATVALTERARAAIKLATERQ